MDNYVRIYDDVLNQDVCDTLIEKFEKHTEQHETIGECRSFTQINFAKSDIWKEDMDTLTKVYMDSISRYTQDCNIGSNQWPSKYALEPMRMKRYLPDGKDEFPDHVDVDATNNITRFLVFFLYLSDNEKGETYFSTLSKSSPCKKGSLLMFPPMWPWLHSGKKPIKKPKYIVGSYLHYVN